MYIKINKNLIKHISFCLKSMCTKSWEGKITFNYIRLQIFFFSMIARFYGQAKDFILYIVDKD